MNRNDAQMRSVVAMCPDCYEIISEPLKLNKDIWTLEMQCPQCRKKVSAPLVDTGIADTVSILNRKGYYTKYCCEGHSIDKGNKLAYIFFESRIDLLLKQCPLPKQWILDRDNPWRPKYPNGDYRNYIIREKMHRKHKGTLVYDSGRKEEQYAVRRMYGRTARLKAIHEWAESLPDLNAFLISEAHSKKLPDIAENDLRHTLPHSILRS